MRFLNLFVPAVIILAFPNKKDLPFYKYMNYCLCVADVDVRDPDEKSIMTYVAQFLQYSKDTPASEEDMQVQILWILGSV